MSTWFTSYGFDQVMPHLWVGAVPGDRLDVEHLRRVGIQRVLNLVADEEYPPGARQAVRGAYAAAGIREARLQLVDYGRLPADRIETATAQLREWLAEDQVAYVHCRAGWQRSAAVAAATIALAERIPLDSALEIVARRRPRADPLPHQREDLAAWWSGRRTAG